MKETKPEETVSLIKSNCFYFDKLYKQFNNDKKRVYYTVVLHVIIILKNTNYFRLILIWIIVLNLFLAAAYHRIVKVRFRFVFRFISASYHITCNHRYIHAILREEIKNTANFEFLNIDLTILFNLFLNTFKTREVNLTVCKCERTLRMSYCLRKLSNYTYYFRASMFPICPFFFNK